MAYGEVKPVGNDYLLTYGNELFYERRYEHAREFAYTFGMVSDKGATEPTNLQDGVLAYFGVEARANSGDVWTWNPMLTLSAGFARNAQQCESDLNNNSQHFGATEGVLGLASPAVYHHTFNGFSQFDITGVLLFNQSGPGKAGRNITFANGCRFSGIENYDGMNVLIENNGAPPFVLRSRGPLSKMWVNGEVGFGDAPIPGIALHVYRTGNGMVQCCGSDSATFRFGDYGAAANLKFADWQWDSGILNLIAYNDNGTLRSVPFGIDTVAGIFRPSTDNAIMLGHPLLRWASVNACAISLKPPASATPTQNEELVIERTSNTQLTFRLRGTDGVVRSASLALA